MPLATGAALTAKTRGEDWIAVAFFGDGALNQGTVLECLNMASIWSLPVVYVCENNHYGEFTRVDDVTAGTLAGRAEAFAIPSPRWTAWTSWRCTRLRATPLRARAAAEGRHSCCATRGGSPATTWATTRRTRTTPRPSPGAPGTQSRRSAASVEDGLADADALAALRKTVEAEIAAVAEAARRMPDAEPAHFGEHVHAG